MDGFASRASFTAAHLRWVVAMWDAINIEPERSLWTAWLVLAVALLSFLVQRKDFPFRRTGYVVLGTLIGSLGVGLVGAALPMGTAHRLVRGFNGATACVAWMTVFAVWRTLPKALALPNLSRVNELLQAEMRERQRIGERLRLVVELAPYPIVMANQNGRIVQVNEQTEQCFGYPRSALVGQPLEVLVPARLRDRFRPDPFSASVAACEQGGRAEFAGLREDGTEFPLEVRVQALVSEREVLVLIAIVDITQQKNAEAALKRLADELQRSNADLTQFAYVASHDLKEPLRKVSSFCQLLKDRYGEKIDADGQRYIDYAVDGSRRMNSLITALLELAQVNSRAAPAATVDVGVVCRCAIDNLSTAIEDSGAKVVCDQELPVVLGDEAQLTQLFQNLIGNAIKFRGPKTPLIAVEARPHNGQWQFAVRDNGIGIDPAQHERVFQIFQRLHTREKYPGTGIGLSICQRIVQRHGGRIWIESEPGCGTTFHFTLPSAPPAVAGDTWKDAVCHAH
ncbi:MAG TPA: ATP-binding protein [Pirellulales bacterium]|nr:ATP-binding protein [Pirellulales bacterium]